MSQIIHKDGKQYLAELMNGVQTRITTLYWGLRNDTPAAADTLATAGAAELAGAAYARVAQTVNSTNWPGAFSGNDWLISMAQVVFAAFTGTPSPNGATHIFCTDQSTGTSGKLLWSIPLQDAAVSSTIQALANSGQAVVVVTNAVAATLNVSDYLLVGTVVLVGTAGNQERMKILTVGAANSGGAGNTNITFTANLANTHQNAEPISRDGVTRTFTSGQQEKMTPSLLMQTGA